MMKVIIIDDEINNSELISNLLKLYCPEVEVIGIASSIQQAYEFINIRKPDLIFLDVQLEDGTGFDLLNCFEKIDFKVIFVSAHLEYAIEAFKISAIDYILKPISPATVISAIKKAEKAISNEELNLKVQQLLGHVSEKSLGKKIILKTFERIYTISIDDVIRFESEGSYSTVFLLSGQKIVVSKLIKDFEEQLVNDDFIRVHQSHLVNLKYVFCFEKADNNLIMKDDSKIPVSSRKKEYVLEMLK